ncbi:MAG: hypothetical protein NZ853_00900 [Leptospiraceae bacterium]|nr:hypothetical protein [Leptospiraceae bacterium]MDW7976213.1 hypothetical protein [Leptospiraceae bacterium]
MNAFKITFIILFALLAQFSYCKTSEIHYIKFVTLNHEDEGFLDNHTLQSIGTSELRHDAASKKDIFQNCLNRAEFMAKERMVFLITNAYLSLTNHKYHPNIYSKPDLIYWGIRFEELLNYSYVASKFIYENKCKIILKLNKQNLLKIIKNYKM